MGRLTFILAVLAGAAVLAAGCGGDDKSSDSGSSSGSGGSSDSKAYGGSGDSSATSTKGAPLALAADPSGKIAFDKKTLSAKAGKTTIDFTNDSQVPHAVEVEGNGVEKETKTITGGKAALTVQLKPGKYTFYCPVADHRQEGMEGTLTVK